MGRMRGPASGRCRKATQYEFSETGCAALRHSVTLKPRHESGAFYLYENNPLIQIKPFSPYLRLPTVVNIINNVPDMTSKTVQCNISEFSWIYLPLWIYNWIRRQKGAKGGTLLTSLTNITRSNVSLSLSSCSIRERNLASHYTSDKKNP